MSVAAANLAGSSATFALIANAYPIPMFCTFDAAVALAGPGNVANPMLLYFASSASFIVAVIYASSQFPPTNAAASPDMKYSRASSFVIALKSSLNTPDANASCTNESASTNS